MKNDTLISCENLYYKIKNNAILDNINLKIMMGDVITVIGPNGAGKSTLAKILIGITSPTSGLIRRKKNLKIGYMPQKVHINNLVPMTAGQFLFLDVNKSVKTKSKIEEVIEANSLNSILNNQIASISVGEWQRLVFARILLKNPDLLLLDEPTQGLDINWQKNFYNIIDKIRQDKSKTIVMISHDLYTVMSSSSHVVCLNKHICCSGLPEIVEINKAYRNLFSIGAGKVLSPYAHHNHHKHFD